MGDDARGTIREASERWEATRRDTDGFRLLKLLKMQGVPEAKYLQARVRVGDLAPERLELAATLNHKPALEALEREREPLPGEPREWFRRIARIQPRHVAVRALLGLAQRVVKDEELSAPVQHQLELVTEWCDDPEAPLAQRIGWEADYVPQGSWAERAAYAAVEAAHAATHDDCAGCPPGVYAAGERLFEILAGERGVSPETTVEWMWHELREWALAE